MPGGCCGQNGALDLTDLVVRLIDCLADVSTSEVCARMHSCAHTHTHTRAHTRAHTHTRERKHTRARAHTHTYTHEHTHTHTHRVCLSTSRARGFSLLRLHSRPSPATSGKKRQLTSLKAVQRCGRRCLSSGQYLDFVCVRVCD